MIAAFYRHIFCPTTRVVRQKIQVLIDKSMITNGQSLRSYLPLLELFLHPFQFFRDGLSNLV